MKRFKLYLYFLIFLLITGCDSENHLVSNNITDENLIYISNFQCGNCGENKYSIDLSWDKYLGSDFVSYQIFDNNDNTLISEITNQNSTSTSIELDINELKLISLVVNNSNEGQILVFTRPVSPVTNISIIGSTNNNILSWTRSTDNDIQNTTLYRTELESGQSLPLINDANGIPDTEVWNDIYNYNGFITTYIDNDVVSNPNYFYIIKTTDTSESYRYGFMQSNIEGAVEAGIINFNINLNPSPTIYPNKTSFTWNDYTNADFYELQIWRNENADFDIDSNESMLIGKFTQPIDNFYDYNDMGTGKTWYYKIRIYNIYGNYIDSEYITCNTSL